METFLSGKTAVITGCNRGIGLTTVERFAAAGANIVACCRQETEDTSHRFHHISERYNVEITPLYFDLSDESAVRQGIKAIKELKKPINCLVNNAGIPHLSLLPFVRVEDIHRVLQVNYVAPLMMIQGLQGPLSKGRPSSIVNIASVAGMDGEIGNSVYGASKAAIIMLTKVVSKEFAAMAIRCNAIAPGLTSTDFADRMGEKAKESMQQSSALHRLATPEEIADAVLFLASDRASFINGQVIRVDGSM